MLKNASIICFSVTLILATGCSHIRPNLVSGKNWPLPQAPIIAPVDGVEHVDGGFYIDTINAVNLANNIDELKAYAKKLEKLIEKMKEYYR